MSLQRVLATSMSAFAATVLMVSLATASLAPSNAFAEGEDLIVREPAQKKAATASDEGGESTWGNSSVNGDFVNLRASYLGLLIAFINFDLEFKISDDWTVGPTVSYWKFDFNSSAYAGGKISAVRKALGVRANWAQNGAYRSGVYLSPMIQLVSAEVTGRSAFSGIPVTATASVPLITGLVGYQWFGPSGWNINVGAGLVTGGSSKVEVRDGTTTSSVETSQTGGLALDFMIGYVF